MKIIGVDLSGPSNHKDTAVVVFKEENRTLRCEQVHCNVSDSFLLSILEKESKTDRIVLGMDAPLSYQDGGGDRPSEKLMRDYVKSIGMSPSSIMTPTFTKMVYLTLRGISLTRSISLLNIESKINIVEVHPGAAIGSKLPSEVKEHILHYKKDEFARNIIFKSLLDIGLRELPVEVKNSSHSIDACGAALGAWYWSSNYLKPSFYVTADPPAHPFDFCC